MEPKTRRYGVVKQILDLNYSHTGSPHVVPRCVPFICLLTVSPNSIPIVCPLTCPFAVVPYRVLNSVPVHHLPIQYMNTKLDASPSVPEGRPVPLGLSCGGDCATSTTQGVSYRGAASQLQQSTTSRKVQGVEGGGGDDGSRRNSRSPTYVISVWLCVCGEET